MTSPLTKAAEAPDQKFEQGFFQLAYDKLQNKLFNLFPYLVGFELVKKSDDGARAVGVFGFKSDNGQILFVPAFFINGKVKDLDVLYSKNYNQFYPLNEDFANLFLKDDVTGMGSMSGSKRKDIENEVNPVDYRDLAIPPRTGRIAYASVLDFIEESDNVVKAAAWKLLEDNPDFTQACLNFYPQEKLAAALKPNMPEAKAPDLAVLTVKSKNIPEELKPTVLSKGYAIKDKRPVEKKSKCGIFQYTNKFSTPTDPGFYSYLTQEGTLRYGLVLKPVSLFSPFPQDSFIVVNLHTRLGQAYNVEYKSLFVRENIKLNDFHTLHKMMIDPAESDPSFTGTFVLINENLKCTQPFRIAANFKDSNGLRRLKVEPVNYFGGENYEQKTSAPFNGEKVKEPRNGIIVFTKRLGDTLSYRSGTIYAPKGFKLLKLTFDDYVDVPWSSEDTQEKRDTKRNEANDLRIKIRLEAPGKLHNMLSYLQENEVYPFHVRSSAGEYFASAGTISKKYSSVSDAKIGMVMDFGLDESEGETLVSSIKTNTPLHGYIKLAYTGDYTPTLIDEAPQTNELGQPTYFGVPYHQVIQEPGYTQDPTRLGLVTTPGAETQDYKPKFDQKKEVQNAVGLAQSGQKELFDTQAIATITKYVDPTTKVVNYIPNFVGTLDKLGRMLFMTYWEADKFQKMYGPDEMPEMVELVKNVFKNLGDLIIFLKRKFPEISINASEQSMSEV